MKLERRMGTLNQYWLVILVSLHFATAIDISADTRVEITCTGDHDRSLPQWRINGSTTADHGFAALSAWGMEILPESSRDAYDANGNAFQTLVINGSAAIHGTVMECVFDGETIFSTTELVFLSSLPPPENLTVNEGVVQWSPPFSNQQTEAVRYFLYSVHYSVEVNDTERQINIMTSETEIDATSFTFQPPPDCIAYTVSVRARRTSVGDAVDRSILATGDYEPPEPIDKQRVSARLQGNTLSVTVEVTYLPNCNNTNVFYITYDHTQYDMLVTKKRIELSVYIAEISLCYIDIMASNQAGNSLSIQVTIDGCMSANVPRTQLNTNDDNAPSKSAVPMIAGVVSGAAVLILLLVITILTILWLKLPRKKKAVDQDPTALEKNTHNNKSNSEAENLSTYIRLPSTSSDRSDSPKDLQSSLTPSQVTAVTIVESESDTQPHTPQKFSSNQFTTEQVHRKQEDPGDRKESHYTDIVTLQQQQQTKCPQLADEPVIYSHIQHAKPESAQMYTEVMLQGSLCSPPSDDKAERVPYTDVQLQAV